MLKLTHSVVDIAITCSHFEESLRFYKEKLGFGAFAVKAKGAPNQGFGGSDKHRF